LPLLLLGVDGGWPAYFTRCCKSSGLTGIGDGKCMDGSDPNPCCGKAECNFACCDCEGGCRDEEYRMAPLPEPQEQMQQKIKLNQWPMLAAHDSATTYAKDRTCTSHRHPINDYAVTQQRGGYKTLLDCGARALDIRPYLKSNGKLIFHHGDVMFDAEFSTALKDVVEWADAREGTFVLLAIQNCHGDGDNGGEECQKEVEKAVTQVGMKYLKCPAKLDISLGEAMHTYALPGGGSVVAVFQNCIYSNYDKSIECYGDGYDCTTDSGRATPFDQLWQYMAKHSNTTGEPHKDVALLWMTQAHWQYSTESIVRGTATRSCIIWDETDSNVNKRVADRIRAGHFRHFNILEVDNVCNHGPELFVALREHAMKKAGLPVDQGVWDQGVDLSHNEFKIHADGHTVSVNSTIVYHVMAGSTKEHESKLVWMEAVEGTLPALTVVDSHGTVLRHNEVHLNKREEWIEFWFAKPVTGPSNYTVHISFTVPNAICKLPCSGKDRLFLHAEWAGPRAMPTKRSVYRLTFANEALAAELAGDVCIEQGKECHVGCNAPYVNQSIEVAYPGTHKFWGFTLSPGSMSGNVQQCTAQKALVTSASQRRDDASGLVCLLCGVQLAAWLWLTSRLPHA